MNAANRGPTHAVVIGGSMAGLVTARVLSDHFERVTVLDRDTFPDDPGFRKGVPQSVHIHALLARGLELLDHLFPGIKQDLAATGAVSVRWPRDVYWLLTSGWSRRFYHPGFEVLGMSRDLLEWSVRQRVLALDRVEIRQQRNVIDLLPGDDGTRVVGVRHTARNRSEGDDTQDLDADLVVDASGRNSRLPRWLEGLGYPQPEETTIDPLLGYASRYYARPADSGSDWKVLFLQPKPPHSTRGGVLFPIDGGRWIVTLAGYGGDYPPTDEDGFLEYARGLRSPVLHEAISEAEPLTSIRGYQRTENRLRHYDRLPRMPEGLVVMGDAMCAFNPIYGQGMTIAAAEVVTLDQCLTEHRARKQDGDLTGLGRAYFEQVAEIVNNAWLLAIGEDLRFTTTEGARPDLRTRLLHRYLDRLLQVAREDARVNRAFGDVVNLVAKPASLFRPEILWKVAKGPSTTPDIGQLPAAMPFHEVQAPSEG